MVGRWMTPSASNRTAEIMHAIFAADCSASPDDPLTGSAGMRLPYGDVNISGHLPAKTNRKRQVRRMSLSRRKFLAVGAGAAAAATTGLTGCGSLCSLGAAHELSMSACVGSDLVVP